MDGGKIDLTNLGEITPLNFEGYLVFALSKDWINRFPEITRFTVTITDIGRLCITSESSIKKRES